MLAFTVVMLVVAAVIGYVRYRRGSYVDFQPRDSGPPPSLDGFDGPDESAH
jgi:hypothetical protein